MSDLLPYSERNRLGPFIQRHGTSAPPVPILSGPQPPLRPKKDILGRIWQALGYSDSTLEPSKADVDQLDIQQHTGIAKICERQLIVNSTPKHLKLEHAALETLQEHDTTKHTPLHEETTTTTKSTFPLMALPGEIVLEILELSRPPAIYCLRQASSTLFRLFNSQGGIEDRHKSPDGSYSIGYVPLESWVETLGPLLKSLIARSLHHHEYCASCLRAEEHGILEAKIAKLWRPLHCAGCDNDHSSALFFPEEPDNHSAGSGGPRSCIGRLGEAKVCSHSSCEPITWRALEDHFQQARAVPNAGNYPTYETACMDRSHEPRTREWALDMLAGSAFPRLSVRVKNYPGRPRLWRIGYEWDLPLLQLSTVRPPSLSAVQETLSSLVVDALHDHRLCPHISANKEIQAFVYSGICDCFIQSGFKVAGCSSQQRKCKREERLECDACGAVLKWSIYNAQVVLSYEYSWLMKDPTSPGWLSLIDQHYRQKLLTEDNRHVLWCDTPGCRTGMGRFWETLVRQNSEDEHWEGREYSDRSDWVEIYTKSTRGRFRNW